MLRGTIETKLEAGGTIPLAGIRVDLLREGQVLQSTRTAADGRFEMHAVGPGIYSLIAYGERGLCAFGVRVFPENVTSRAIDEIATLAIPGEDHPAVFRIIQQELSRHAHISQLSQTDKLLKEALTSRRVGRIDRRASSENGIESPAEPVRHHPVYVDDQGCLRGRVRPLWSLRAATMRPIVSLKAFLVRAGKISSETRVAEDGTFEFARVKPGLYGFVVAGQDGFGAVQIEIRRARSSARAGQRSGFRPAAYYRISQATFDFHLDVALIPRADFEVFAGTLPPEVTGGLVAPLPGTLAPLAPFGSAAGAVGGGAGALGTMGVVGGV
ncbi:MAG: hypothetical protein GXP27_18995, partial [Planctomycetes bacterium]|nr:hypothetical protein [Planctomycetota bacterium]